MIARLREMAIQIILTKICRRVVLQFYFLTPWQEIFPTYQ